MGIIEYSKNTAFLIMGSLTTAVTLISILAYFIEIDLPEFTASIVGYYEYIRDVIFHWMPGWWSEIHSNYFILYSSVLFIIFRGLVFANKRDGGRGINLQLYIVYFVTSILWPFYIYLCFNATRDGPVTRRAIELRHPHADEETRNRLAHERVMRERTEVFYVTLSFLLTLLCLSVLFFWDAIKALLVV